MQSLKFGRKLHFFIVDILSTDSSLRKHIPAVPKKYTQLQTITKSMLLNAETSLISQREGKNMRLYNCCMMDTKHYDISNYNLESKL